LGPGSFDDLIASYFDLRWHFDPVDASAAGLPAHDGRLGTFTGESVRAHLAALRSIMGAVEEVALDDLEDEIDRTALLNDLRVRVHRLEVELPHERDPGYWLEHLFDGLYQPLALRDRAVAHRARAATERLRGVPAFLADATATLQECPHVLVALARGMARGGARLIDELTAAFPDAEDGADTEAADAARSALAEFVRHLDGPLAQDAGTSFAIGEDAFNFRLHFEHALPSTAAELWRYGHRLADEVEERLGALAAEIQPGAHWHEVMEALRDRHPAAHELVGAYAAEMERARAFVEAHELAPVPPGALDVLATPPFLRPTVPFAAYQPPGAFSTDRSGRFFVSPPDGDGGDAHVAALRDHCSYEIPATALHEGFPGHHLQFLNAHASPRPLRRVLATPLTVEGWALYCEQMMGEEGFFRSVEERFFQHVALLWRGVRVIVDVGLHTRGMTFEEAVALLVDRVRFEPEHAKAEVQRYCARPAYQLAYAVGWRELTALREDYRRAVGERYSLRAFHDAVLAYGGFPISLMRWGLGLDA